MSKWILDIQSGTLVQAENCVIFDDTAINAKDWDDTDDAFITHAEAIGTAVLNYKDPKQVHISWDIEDVQTLCMNLTDAQALEALQKVSRSLRDESISFGWEVLEIALASAGYEITIDEEKD
jgi:hypothetical protein